MAPRKKTGTRASSAVTTSPRRTRSATAGKRRVAPLPAEAPAKRPAKKQKAAKEVGKKADAVAPAADANGSSEAIIIEAW